jgi:hypothetical protein
MGGLPVIRIRSVSFKVSQKTLGSNTILIVDYFELKIEIKHVAEVFSLCFGECVPACYHSFCMCE